MLQSVKVKDVSHYCNNHSEDYVEIYDDYVKRKLGCVWCYKDVSVKDAASHIV